jgi:hypothetical protein
MTRSILCTPVGLSTPEGEQRVAKAMERLHRANTNAANLLTQMWDEKCFEGGEDPLTDNERDEIKHTVEAKQAAQEELLRAIDGAPEAAR